MAFNFDPKKVSFHIEAEQDNTPLRGNVMDSGDADHDRQVEMSIANELRHGNVWVWASVRVVATYDGIDGIEGEDFLGCCSYDSEEDFRECPYFADMCNQAMADLESQLEEIYQHLS